MCVMVLVFSVIFWCLVVVVVICCLGFRLVGG